MKHFEWQKHKPEFTEECLLLIAKKWKDQPYEYDLFEIKKLDGENEDGSYGWYWGLVCTDGAEWGDLADLAADQYFTMPLLNSDQEVKVSDTTGSDSSYVADNQSQLPE
jgi:hypothetical protein